MSRPMAASHRYGRARERAATSSSGSTTRGARAPASSDLDPDPGLDAQVADVVGLLPVCGYQPEGVAGQAIADRGVSRLAGAAAGGLQQGERVGCQAAAQRKQPYP